MSSALVRRTLSFAAMLAVAVVAVLTVGLSRHGTDVVHADTAPAPDTVTVTGAGTADGAPDTLNADFRVHVTRGTVQDAINAQAAAARRVLAALSRSGVARKHVQTVDLSIEEHYNNSGVIVGYDASETIRARISPLAAAGHTITAAATAAGNDVTVGGLSFDIADDDPLVTQARGAAFADAHARAQQYADLAGRRLGRVLQIRESVDRPAPTRYPYADALFAKATAGRPGVPIRGGRQTLAVHVNVVWALT